MDRQKAEPAAEKYEGCDCGGEHRTTGGRAWCLDCSEWCYPGEGMQCEIAVLRAENADLKKVLQYIVRGARLDPTWNESAPCEEVRAALRRAIEAAAQYPKGTQ